ncbi:hypothetical protein BK816_05695 [Boudabousia tangfeifanii]|uniref:Peptidoglycan glycosyltransferase n=1 Tax=Boudabousia tangfeifanii TaxID=1912795 RepID=A0A1D9MML5_9ACTO|nr:hypothetical protein BK816_05695 [Boudabousia tangfeifanii]
MSRPRLTLLVGLFGMAFLGLTVVLFFVQVVYGQSYAQEGIRNRMVGQVLTAERGKIYDSTGQVLASSSTRYDLVADPVNLSSYVQIKKTEDENGKVHREIIGRGPLAAAKQLAPLLKMNPAELGGMLTQNPHSYEEAEAEENKVNQERAKGNTKYRNQYRRNYQLVAKDLTPEVARQINDLHIVGIKTIEKSQRLYPRGDIAANIIGTFAYPATKTPEGAPKRVGVTGIEKLEQNVLKATPGYWEAEIGGNGAVIPGGEEHETPAVPGTDVHLTINADLNAFAQKVADETKERFQPDWVVALVEEVKTGRLLAIGDSGVVNPQNAKPGTPVLFSSRAASATYPPGSTAKVVTVAQALEEAKITPLTPVMSYGKITMPNGETFQDSHQHPAINMTAAGIIAESSNTGTVQIGDKVSDEARYNLMRAFGWGEKTGVQLTDESAGILPKYDKWGGRTRYATMFGQGFNTTPLQVVNMLATIGNGGVKNKVHLVDGYTKPDGHYEKVDLGQPKRVISEKTAKELVRMMEGVVTEEGTAPEARLDGYNVAGKSGTSELLSKNPNESGVVASFGGILPAENPVAAVLVVAYRPKSGVYGGVVAVPAFKQLALRTMQTLGVRPSEDGPDLFPLKVE